MTPRRWWVLGLAVAGLLILPACSDDEESLSEEEFVEQANEICDEGSDELEEANEEIFGSSEQPTPEAIADFADVFEESIDGQIDDLEALDGPDDLEDDLEPILDDAREILDEFADLVRDDPETAFTSEDPFLDINERLRELGLTSCAD